MAHFVYWRPLCPQAARPDQPLQAIQDTTRQREQNIDRGTMAKEIKLGTSDKTTIVSDEDQDLTQFNWRLNKDGYVRRRPNRSRSNPDHNKEILIHRVILARMLPDPLSDTDQVDHIDLNKLNNTRENLRKAKNEDNAKNRGLQKNNTSGVKGVYWDNKRQKWRAEIVVNSVRKRLGRFEKLEDAAKAYDDACILYHKEFARPNKKN